MIDLDDLIRETDPARDVVIPPGDPSAITGATARSARRRRRIVDGLAVAAAGAVALGVALIVLLAGGHAPLSSTSGPSSIPAAARPFVRILGVLRRPPTGADRAAASRIRGGHVERSLIRLAGVTPWGEHVIFVPSRSGGKGTLMLLTTATTVGHSMLGFIGGFTASQIEQGQAWAPDELGAFNPKRGMRILMVVPDGVARVAFGRAHELGVKVQVHNNLAFAQITDCCGSRLLMHWFAADGRLIRTTFGTSGTETHKLGPPAINLPPGTVTVARLREPNGTPFRLTLQRIRFQGHKYLCLAVVQRGTGQSCENPLPLPDRPLVVVTNFPMVCKPHPAQLVWGLALSDVSVAVRAGGGEEVAARKSIPAALRVPGSLFYVWAQSAPATLVARATGGTVVETRPVDSGLANTPAAICAGR